MSVIIAKWFGNKCIKYRFALFDWVHATSDSHNICVVMLLC